MIASLFPRIFMNKPATMQKFNLDPSSQNAMTFITCPAPVFTEEDYRRYRLAMTSWLLTDPKSRLVIFTGPNMTRQDVLVANLKREFGQTRVISCDQLKRDTWGGTWVQEWFVKGLQLARTKISCFINPDIVVDRFWFGYVKAALSPDETRPAHITGLRLNVKVTRDQLLNFAINHRTFYTDITTLFKAGNVSCVTQFGSSYFLWRTDQRPFPPSEIPWFKPTGFFWDQWLNGHAQSRARTETVGLDAPVYYLESSHRELDLSHSGSIYHNAKIAFERGGLLKHDQILSSSVDKNQLDAKRLLTVPVCSGREKIPIVKI
jgi:hypothetical protein